MRRSFISLLFVVGVSLLALAACGQRPASGAAVAPMATTPEPATASATTNLCTGVAQINQAFTSLANVNANTTVGEVRAVQAKVANTITAIQAKVPTDDQGLLAKVSAANDNLTAKLQNYPDLTPIGQTSDTIQDLKTKVADAQTTTGQLATKLNCMP